jgi:hypothetical protein
MFTAASSAALTLMPSTHKSQAANALTSRPTAGRGRKRGIDERTLEATRRASFDGAKSICLSSTSTFVAALLTPVGRCSAAKAVSAASSVSRRSATATGLGRASVSTTFSKLAKSGELTKGARGYQLAGQTPANAPADAAPSADGEQLGT